MVELEGLERAVEEGRFADAMAAVARSLGKSTKGLPDFRLKERDPRQDLQYGESLRLCEDPEPYRKARKILQDARSRGLPAPALQLLASVVETFLGDFSSGRKPLDFIVRARPNWGCAWAWRGVRRALACRGRRSPDGLRAASADLDRAVALGFGEFALPWRAELRHDLDDREGALADLGACLKTTPGNPWARVEAGEILCELGRFDEAMKIFNRLAAERPKAAWAFALRGRTLATTGREKQSLADLRRAISLDPASAANRAWLSETLRRLGRYREALVQLDRAVALNPGYVLAWVWRGRMKLILGRPAEALRDLNRAIAMDRRYLLAFAWRGEALFKLGRKAAAARDFKKIAPMDPGKIWNPVLPEGQAATPALRAAAWRRSRRAPTGKYRPKVAVMAAMARGRKRMDAGDLNEAIGEFGRAEDLDPNCAQALLYRAGLKLIAGDQAGGLSDLRAISDLDHSTLPAYRDLTTLSAEEFPALVGGVNAALKAEPDCAWAWVLRAFSLRSLMRYEEAIKDLDRAVALEPRSAALWAMRSRVKLTNTFGFYDGVSDMKRAVALAPDWGWLNCWLGEALRHAGRFREALAALDRGVRQTPGYRRGWAWRGGVLVALGRYKEAIRSLDRSLAFDPIYHYDFEYTADQKSWAYNQRQLADRGLGDIPGALRDLNKAHQFGPRYLWVYNPKNKPALFERGLRELDRASARRPRLAWAFAWKGQTLLQMGRLPEAVENLERALALSPSGWAWAWKGRALLNLGKPAEAAGALDRAVAASPDYAPAWGWRGEARRLLGRTAAAAEDFSKAVRLDHRCSWAWAGRGECRLALGKTEEALKDLDRAVGICPDYAEGYAWRAEARRLSGDAAGALKDADAAIALKPGLIKVYVTRSLLRGARGDSAGQNSDLRRALRLDPGLLERAQELDLLSSKAAKRAKQAFQPSLCS